MIEITQRWTFREWCSTAKTGECCIYHVGYLLRDRFNDQMAADWAKRAHDLATEVMDHYLRGEVALIQRRVSDGICEYIAVRRTRKGKKKQ